MRLEPLYTVTFRTPEAWSVEVVTDAGIEGRSFLAKYKLPNKNSTYYSCSYPSPYAIMPVGKAKERRGL